MTVSDHATSSIQTPRTTRTRKLHEFPDSGRLSVQERTGPPGAQTMRPALANDETHC
jgi:hypothetical protein